LVPFDLKSSYLTWPNAVTAVRAPLATTLKLSTGGLLNPLVYRQLYRLAGSLPDLPFVDIGAAGGTGTIALAHGYARAGKRSPILAVEKCRGGTRLDYGGYEDNLARLERNLRRFRVRHRVTLVTEELGADAAGRMAPVLGGSRLAGFLHDADGRLDRDFGLFWELVVPGGLIVVDDDADRPEFKPVSARHPDGGTKCLLTFELLNVLRASGHFEEFARVGDTAFGRKPAASDLLGELPYAELEAARERVRRRREQAMSTA
jgi:predicted O-methyltransferase YrrM